jgi:hypothetical protein
MNFIWRLFFCNKEKHMNTNKDSNSKERQSTEQQSREQEQHSSAFKETSRGDEKSTTNVEEEVELEQERKEAMTERD